MEFEKYDGSAGAEKLIQDLSNSGDDGLDRYLFETLDSSEKELFENVLANNVHLEGSLNLRKISIVAINQSGIKEAILKINESQR